MHILGFICLLIALLCSIGASGFALIQLWHQNYSLIKPVRITAFIVAFLLLLASALLLHALFWQDYAFEYVASYTDSNLSVFYRLTAFWAGQSGSMLFWALVTSICGAIFACNRISSKIDNISSCWFWTFYHTIMAFFCLILTSWSNPFMLLDPAPLDGNGLNPLLQNPGMIFHPPLLFMGYATFTPPACLALAQSCSQVPKDWSLITRPFIIFAWILLTAGIILGAWWAYMELGWGGYWGWDPVENASLLPWLCAAACIHVLIIKKYEGKAEKAAIALMALTITASFFATYLTRSGVIQSVHAFGDGGVGTPLLIFTFSTLLITAIASSISTQNSSALSSPFSREGLLVLTGWIFMALAIIIMIATLWPVLTRLFSAASSGLDANFYNKVCLPLVALLLIILAFCEWSGWKKFVPDKMTQYKILTSCIIFICSLAAIWFAGYHKILPLLSASAGITIICSLAMRIIKKEAFHKFTYSGAFGAHLGVALIAIGVSFSGAYVEDNELTLSKNKPVQVGTWTVELENLVEGEGAGYIYQKARLKISNNGKEITTLEPERRIYSKFGSMQFSEVDVYSSFARDLYASLLGMDEDFNVIIKFSIEPLVNLIWAGGIIMCIIPLFSISRKLIPRKNNAELAN